MEEKARVQITQLRAKYISQEDSRRWEGLVRQVEVSVGGRGRTEAALSTRSLSPGLEGINIKDRVSLLPRNMPLFIGVFQTTSEHSLADH